MPVTAGVGAKKSGTLKSRVSEHSPGEVKKPVPSKNSLHVNEAKKSETGKKIAKNPAGTKPKKVVGEQRSKDGGERRIGSAILDKVPKKSAQRTKGSLSLGKPMEKADGEATGKGSASVDRIRPMTREGSVTTVDVHPKVKTQEKPVRVRSSRKLAKPKPEKPSQEKNPDVQGKSWKKEEAAVEKEVEPAAMMERHETKSTELPCLGGPPSSTCSFFGKLQQGVKAYFSSRNSFEDKNKTKVAEGGIRTRTGVAKGPKEEPKKRKRNVTNRNGIKLKNKVKNSDSAMSDRLGLKLKAGGQSNNFLTTRPKILRHFRKLKRKKLYHPKKHYVRIEIPRKGYFYRSIVQLKDPGTPSLPPLRVESDLVPKEQEVQIPRVASPSAKGSHIFQKRMNGREQIKSPEEWENGNNADDLQNLLDSFRAHTGIPYTPEYLDHMSSLLLKGKTVGGAAENLSEDDSRHVPPVGTEEILSKLFDDYEKEEKGRARAMSKNSRFEKNERSKMKRKLMRVCVTKERENPVCGNGGPPEMGVKSEAGICQKTTKTHFGSRECLRFHEMGFQGLVNSLNDVMAKKALTWNLEITPNAFYEETITPAVLENLQLTPTTFSKDSIAPTIVENLQITPETFYEKTITPAMIEKLQITPLTFYQTLAPAMIGNLQMMFEPLPNKESVLACIIEEPIQISMEIDNDLEMETLHQEAKWVPEIPLAKTNSDRSVKHLTWIHSEDNLAASLAEDIDLHLELQNYLKAFGGPSESQNASEKQDFDISRFLNSRSLSSTHSNSSFVSATSDCYRLGSNQEVDGNYLVLCHERNHNLATNSNEQTDLRLTTFISQMRVCNDQEEIKKIKSDDQRSLEEEYHSRSSIKRTFGKTSFHLLQGKENEVLATSSPPQLLREIERRSSISAADGYTKIFPFPHFHGKQKKNKSKILYRNLDYSLSADLPNNRSPLSSSNQFQQNDKSSENDAEMKRESADSKEAFDNDGNALAESDNARRWSPSLQELIDIYNSVLKQHQKLKNSSKNSIKRCISNHLFSFLIEKFKEKKYKNDLMKLCKDNLFTPKDFTQTWDDSGKESLELKEYVNVFQEILSSSLSISQISRMNDMIADLQEYVDSQKAELKYLKPKPILKPSRKSKEVSSAKLHSKKAEPKPSVAPKPELKKIDTGRKEIPKRYIPPRVKKSTPKEVKREPEVKEVDFSSPKELESMLQSCFYDSTAFRGSSPRGDPKNKVLVSVKLAGDQILVSRMSYFKNEKSLTGIADCKRRESSELIIENVGSQYVKLDPSSLRKTQEFTSRKKTNTISPQGPKRKLKPVAKGTAAKKTVKTIKTVKQAEAPPDELRAEEQVESVNISVAKRRSAQTFEYNQELLKMQHPIEAIIESSESKIDERVDVPQQIEEPTINAQTPKQTPEQNEIPRRVLTKSVSFSNDVDVFDSNFLSQEEQRKALDRAKSFIIHREVKEKHVGDNDRHLGAKKKYRNPQKKAKSLDDTSIMMQGSKRLPSKRKNRKVMPLRPRTMFLCYPSLFKAQDGNVPKGKKKLQETKKGDGGKKAPNSRPTSASKSQIQNLPKKSGEISKRPSRDLKLKTQKSEANSHNSVQVSEPAEAHPDIRLSTNTILFLNTEISPDGCSIEFLFNDKSENQSINASSKSSALDVLKKNEEKEAAEETTEEPSVAPPEESGLAITREASPSAMVGTSNESPIVLHGPSNNCDDTSFPSLMVQSDSYLKCHSSFAITRSKINNLFRSNSDMKFYPGRVTDDSQEQSPFVTFVLTPKQKEGAGVPSQQIQVVNKVEVEKELEQDAEDTPKDDDQDDEEEDGKLPLNSIEQFINLLSAKRKAALRKKCASKPKMTHEKPLEKSKLGSKEAMLKRINSFVPCQRLQALYASDRKAYHECQLKKQLKKKVNKIRSRGMREAKKLGLKKGQKSEKFPRPTDLLQSLPSVSVNIKQEDFKTGSEGVNTQIEITGDDKKEKKPTEDAKLEDPQPGCSSSNTSRKMDTRIRKNEVLNLVKKAIQGTEGLLDERKIMSAIKLELEKREAKSLLIKDGVSGVTTGVKFRNRSSNSLRQFKGGTFPKRLRTLKIKINCNNHRLRTKEGSRTEGRAGEEQPMVSPSIDDRCKSQQVLPLPRKTEAMELLDSLVSKEPEVGDLGKTQSTYFDAVEWTQEGRSSADEVGDHLDPYKKEPYPCGNSQDSAMEVKDKDESRGQDKHYVQADIKKPRERIMLTLSDERLLFNDGDDRWEEKVFNKIQEALQSGNTRYSVALTEALLRKTTGLSIERDNSARLMEVLQSVENKSKSLMVTMEKNAWFKILALLDELFQAFATSTVNISDKEALKFLTTQIKKTKACIDKVQILNSEKLMDFQTVCSSHDNLDKFRDAVFRITEPSETANKETFRNAPEHDQPWSQRILESPRLPHNPHQEETDRISLRSLKNDIRQQRLYIQYLINADYGPVPAEIQNVKNKVAEKMKFLEEKMTLLDSSWSSESSENSGDAMRDNTCSSLGTTEKWTTWDSATSFPNAVETSRTFKRVSGDSEEEEEAIASNYNLMKSLVKVWNTRGSSISGADNRNPPFKQ